MSKRRFYQKKRVMIPLVIGIALIFLGLLSAIISSFYLTTSNAYVEEYQISINPKTKGKIIELNMQNNTLVKKGEIIAELEAQNVDKKVKTLEESFLIAQNKLKSFENEITKINIKTKQNQKNLQEAKAYLENANDDYIRYKNEFKDGTVTKKDLDNAIKNLELAQVQYEEIQAQYKITSNSFEKIIDKKDSQIDELKIILQELEQAKYEQANATITAKKSGKIIGINAKIGDVVDEKTKIATIIPDECFIMANFKKLPSKKLKLGQKATVKIYTLDFKTFEGEVVQILDEKSNLIPVKIRITNTANNPKIKSKARAYVKVKTE